MKYIVLSTAVTDDIYFPDGSSMLGVGGGAGWYACAGMKIWSDEVILVSGVGKNFLSMHGSWFSANKISTAGLMIRDDRSPKTKVVYEDDGEREETPEYGYDHYKKIEPLPEDIEPFCDNCKGVYVFKNTDDLEFWQHLIDLKKRYGFSLMWEISADATDPRNIENIISIIPYIDILSINLTEAIHLFQASKDDVIEKLRSLGVQSVFFRRGAQGATVITQDDTTEVPAISPDRVMDPTGAGNSSSGAFLVGFCEGRSSLDMGLMGSISASCMITQYGPIPLVSSEIRQKAVEILNNIKKVR